MRANAPQLPGGGGWAHLELTDALLCGLDVRGSFISRISEFCVSREQILVISLYRLYYREHILFADHGQVPVMCYMYGTWTQHSKGNPVRFLDSHNSHVLYRSNQLFVLQQDGLLSHVSSDTDCS